MSSDLLILTALRDRQRFKTLVSEVPQDMLGQDAAFLLNWFNNYWEAYPEHGYLDTDALGALMKLRGKYNKEQLAIANHHVNLLSGFHADPAAIKGVVRNLTEMRLAGTAGRLITDFNNGAEVDLAYELSRLSQDTVRSIGQSAPSEWIQDDIMDILKEEASDVGLKLPTKALQTTVKGLLGGSNVFVAARPDQGKTTFMAQTLAGFAQQMEQYFDPDRPILWFNNEGKGRRIIPRIYQAALGVTVEELGRMGEKKLRQQYTKAVGRADRIRIKDIHGATIPQLEQVIEAMRPCVVVFDMIANVRLPGGSGNRAEEIELKAQAVRDMAVIHDFVALNTIQISAEGDNMLYPPYSALKDSKCLATGTLVRMYDGSQRRVETIREGELVMGPDSTPRRVTGPVSGFQPMFKVSGKGWEFTCNQQHILTCIKSTVKPMNGHSQGQVVDLPLEYFLKNPSRLRHYKAIRASIEYPVAELPIDPYTFGLWLGDGAQRELRVTTADTEIREWLEALPGYRHTYRQDPKTVDVYFGSRQVLRDLGVYKNKHIPQIYKIASKEQRRLLLAGIMDSDGWVDHGGSVVSMSKKRARLLADIEEVCASLGYRTSVRDSTPIILSSGAIVEMRTVSLGNTEPLPVKLKRRSGLCAPKYETMHITPQGIGQFHGFTVDKDSRYVLGNYITTHNTGVQGAADVLIMIGALHGPEMAKVRGIATPKNKMSMPGRPGHIQSEVIFNPEIARYED